jgi:hypothetical protein
MGEEKEKNAEPDYIHLSQIPSSIHDGLAYEVSRTTLSTASAK